MMIDPRASRSWLTMLILASALVFEARDADAASCGSAPGDDAAIAAIVADARAACPCDGFSSRMTYRRCVRERVTSALLAGTLPARCRATVVRYANRSTCGNVPSAVTCCVNVSTSREACTISRSDLACRAWRGGKGQVGSSDWCHDACPPEPTPGPPTPTPTVTTTPSGPIGLGPRCVCRCGPLPSPWPSPWPNTPYAPHGCPSFHDCVVPSFVPTGSAECDALDDGDNRGCHYNPDAPDPNSPNGPVVDFCTL
jgi:hypothetical protein